MRPDCGAWVTERLAVLYPACSSSRKQPRHRDFPLCAPAPKACLAPLHRAERRAITATNAEVDQEVERIARQDREPVPAVRKKLAANGMLDRIASHIATEKTLNFLFEHSTKTVPEPEHEPAPEEAPAAE